MKKLIILTIAALFLSACGSDYHTIEKVPVEVEVPVAQDFEGVFYFENGSQIELVAGYDGDVTILRSGQSLQSINPQNDTLGSHPTVSGEGFEVSNGKIFFFSNANYTGGNDLEEDVSGSNITGQKRTDYLIELLGDGRLQLTIKIYSDKINNNANYVVATRIFTSL